MTPFVSEPLPIPSDETVRLTGAPPDGLIWRTSDWYVTPFTLMWGGFAIFWEAMAFTAGAPLVFMLWGVPFVCVGLYLIVGRFFWDSSVRARTRYAITDRAAYVVVTGLGGRVRRYAGAALAEVAIDRKPDGSGTLRFGSDTAARGPWAGGRMPLGAPNAFEAIHDLDGAYAAARAAVHG